MSVFLAQFGQYDDAITHLNKAAQLSPDKQQILMERFSQGTPTACAQIIALLR